MGEGRELCSQASLAIGPCASSSCCRPVCCLKTWPELPQEPPEKFVTFQCCGGVLRPQTLTNSTQFLRDKALYHVEVTTLHWNPFLSVMQWRARGPSIRSWRSFLKDRVESRRFDLWSGLLLLSCSLEWSRGGLPVHWGHCAHHPRRPAQPIARTANSLS